MLVNIIVEMYLDGRLVDLQTQVVICTWRVDLQVVAMAFGCTFSFVCSASNFKKCKLVLVIMELE